MELSYFKAALLGILQGFTEFLPVSSSGHIVIAKRLFFVQSVGILYEVFLHFGTFLSVLFVFRREIADIVNSLYVGLGKIFKENSFELLKSYKSRLGIFVIVGSIPSGAVGILFKDELSSLFDKPFLVSIFLLFTGIILYITKYINEKDIGIRFLDSIIIGCAQALAILPGISRSGMTISVGIFSGLKKEETVKFSFFLALPAILGATILETFEIIHYNLISDELIHIFVGFLSAFLSGYIAIKLLLKIVIAGKLYLFSFYCFLLGIFGIIAFI